MDLKQRVVKWVRETYGESSLLDRKNRAARVLEEACELFQAENGSEEVAGKIVQRCFSRPVGDVAQELAGVRFTLFAYEFASDMNAEVECAKEVDRVSAMDPNHFRKKQAKKFALGTDYAVPCAELNKTGDDNGL